MRRFILSVPLIVSLLISCGCAGTTGARLVYQAGVTVETLSAAASLSISRGEQGMGSSGYLLYRRPDRMRLVILTPFGTTMMEVIVSGERITIIDHSRGAAFSGSLQELPAGGQGETWRHARWVMETDPPGRFAGTGSTERVSSLGGTEKVFYENGLVVSKALANGDSVSYREYVLVNGVPLATEIIMHSHDDGRFRIRITDPEVNTELSPEAFTGHLEGLTVYPLSALKE